MMNTVRRSIRGMRQRKDERRDRILDDDEIRAVWKACADMGTFGALVKIAMLTVNASLTLCCPRVRHAGQFMICVERQEV